MVTLLFLFLSSIAACNTDQHDRPQETSREALLSRWSRYQGQDVVVGGLVVFGEGAIMYLPRLPDLPIGDTDKTEAMSVIPSIAMERNPGRLELEYLKYAGTTAVVLLRGRFTGAQTRQFGHQNCCRFRLEITEVLSVRGATPDDR